MKLERNRAERRSKRGVSILYNGIPYLIFAALAAGFLLGAPQMIAASSIAQAGKSTVSVVERTQFPFALIGYMGKTNSVLSRGFTESDFTFTGSKVWVDDLQGNWRLKFTSSGTFTPKKNVIVDIFFLGGGAGGGDSNGYASGGGGGSGRTGQWTNITLTAGQACVITIGAGGGAGGAGGTTSFVGGSLNGAVAGGDALPAHWQGSSGGSGGGTGTNTSLTNGGYGGSNGGNGGSGSVAGAAGQGTTTYEFGNSSLTLYAGAGGAGAFGGSGGAGGAGGGAPGASGYSTAGGNASPNTGGGGGGASRGKYDYSNGASGGSGGSGICVIRNHR